MTDLVHRHLSCIMFTDMVGYSALAQRDEALAMELVAEQRALLRPIFGAHRGREIKSTGDGFLVEFASALEATRCAVELQRALVDRNAAVPAGKRFQIRVGLHLGDIEVQEGDVFGDGVNVAARVQQCAPSGGVCVSAAVADQVRNKLEHPLEGMGTRRLKNIAQPVELYRVVLPWERRSRWTRVRAAARYRARPLALGGLAVLAAIGLGWAAFQGTRPSPASEIRSVAVLPLDDLSPNPSEAYFSDGMTDALIAGLSKIGSLRVISRTSAMHYRDTDKRLPDIARELDVDAVLEGSVVRAGDRVRISVRLIHASSERALWSETYDRDLRDVLALQDDVARAIATEVEAELTPGERTHLSSARSVDPEAYEAHLRGRYWQNTRTRDGLDRAFGYFRRAIEIDPTWGAGYAGLADVYQILGYNGFSPPEDVYPKALAAASKAIELDESLAEAHQVLSGVMLNYEWDWSGSEREIRRALELDPNYARGWQTYAFYFVTLGRMEDALGAIRKAANLDPLSPRINANVGYFLYFARDYEAAEREAMETLEMEPLLSGSTLGGVYVQQSRHEEAIRAFEEVDRRGGPGGRAGLAWAHATAGNRAEAQRILAEVERRTEFVDPMAVAPAYAALGDFDQAFAWLERAYRERALQPWRLQGEPWWDPIRDDLRFVDLLHRMGLEPARPPVR